MSFDEHYMDTKVHETMDLLYEDQKTLPKKPLNRKPFIQNDGSGETNRSGKHATAVKNDAEETAVDSMIRVLNESANEVLEETMNLILAAIKIVDYKRRRKKNQASEQTTIKLNKENFLSRKHATVVKNDTKETAADSMMRVLNENANEVLEEIMNLILAATRIVDFNCLSLAPLIRNYYHKKVAPISKGAYALHDFLMLWGLESRGYGVSPFGDSGGFPPSFPPRLSSAFTWLAKPRSVCGVPGESLESPRQPSCDFEEAAPNFPETYVHQYALV
ncbi:hypothetical protein H5410_057004 [Solanum commersonii]|uniref:Uncharacterized protein n=1 Tax=Solanum commersonii TaxID=4109 RepID=A0A9J5WPN3_SOLCO|nr:hypothetical protein H5410_057004 [Solanum commersonii]